MDILFLAGRILFGGFFLMMGMNHFMKRRMLAGYAQSKGVPAPGVAVFLTGLLLTMGGLGVIFDIYTNTALWLLVIFLVPTSFMMHKFWSVAPDQKMVEMTNFMKNMALAGAALWLIGFIF